MDVPAVVIFRNTHIICCGECFLMMVMDFALSNMFSFFGY